MTDAQYAEKITERANKSDIKFADMVVCIDTLKLTVENGVFSEEAINVAKAMTDKYLTQISDEKHAIRDKQAK